MASVLCVGWVFLWASTSPFSTAFSSTVRSDRRAGTAVFSFNVPQQNSYNDINNINNGYMNNNNNNNLGYVGNDAGRERFKMVKQFNGDYKTVPIDEYYEQASRRNDRESVASEYGVLRATRGANPYLTSPAREMISKPWEWQRPPPPGMRPRFRQVQTFSGDVKTVREDENPYLDGRVLKNQYGRVDGTGYVPDMGPESASTIRYAPSRRRYDYGEPPRGGPSMYQQQPQGPPMYQQQQQPSSYYPPPPPPRSSRQDRRRDYDMRAGSRDVDPRYVGDEFRREMRKYRRDDMDRYEEPDDFYFDKGGRNGRQGPLETLAKEAEKVIKSVTNIGGPYSRDERRQRKRDMGYLRRAASERDMMYPPPPLGPPPLDMRYNDNNINTYYPEGRRSRNSDLRDGNIAGSFDSSRAVRSFEQPRSGYYPGPRPPYQSRRPQYDGSRYSNDNYENPAARSEQGRLW
jgi:hypothetical protein